MTIIGSFKNQARNMLVKSQHSTCRQKISGLSLKKIAPMRLRLHTAFFSASQKSAPVGPSDRVKTEIIFPSNLMIQA